MNILYIYYYFYENYIFFFIFMFLEHFFLKLSKFVNYLLQLILKIYKIFILIIKSVSMLYNIIYFDTFSDYLNVISQRILTT